MDWNAALEAIEDAELRDQLARAQKSAWCEEREGWRVAMPLVLQGRWQDLVDVLEDTDAVKQLRAAKIYSLGTTTGPKEFTELRVGGGRV